MSDDRIVGMKELSLELSEMSSDEVIKFAQLEKRLRDWARADEEGGVDNIDRRAAIVGALLGWPLNKERKIQPMVESISELRWSDSSSTDVVMFLRVIAESEPEGDLLADLGKKFPRGDRKMVDKVLEEKLKDAELDYDGDLGVIKLAVAVMKKLDGNGEISDDGLERLIANFQKRARFWDLKEVGKTPAEVMGDGHKKWNPSPMSAEFLSDFVNKVLMYAKDY